MNFAGESQRLRCSRQGWLSHVWLVRESYLPMPAITLKKAAGLWTVPLAPACREFRHRETVPGTLACAASSTRS